MTADQRVTAADPLDDVDALLGELMAALAAARAAGLNDPAGRQRAAQVISNGRLLFDRKDIREDNELRELAVRWDHLQRNASGWPACAATETGPCGDDAGDLDQADAYRALAARLGCAR